MPIDDYKCEKCNYEVELTRRISDPHPTSCPECEQPSLKKQFNFKPVSYVKGAWMAPEFAYDSETTYVPEKYGRKR